MALVTTSDRHSKASSAAGNPSMRAARNRRAALTWSAVAGNARAVVTCQGRATGGADGGWRMTAILPYTDHTYNELFKTKPISSYTGCGDHGHCGATTDRASCPHARHRTHHPRPPP